VRSLLLVLCVGCGDNQVPLTPCTEVEPAAFTAGPYADPYAVELLGCVEGGLGDVAGRWFLRDADELFRLSYPRYEPTCDGGARLAGRDDYTMETEEGDVSSSQQWWDGTRWVSRAYRRYVFADFEYVTVHAVCARADGTLVGRWVNYDADRGERTGPLLGTRFDRKDELAVGLELVGEVGTSSIGEPIDGFNVVVEAGVAYVAGTRGLDLIDVTVPDAPRAIGHFEDVWNDVRVVRGETEVVAFGANSLETVVVDVTEPTRPTFVGALLGDSGVSSSHSLQVANNRLYVADYSDAVPVFDVSNPLVPIPLGSVLVPDADLGIHDLTVAGDRLFINQTEAGFVAVDVSGGLDTPSVLGRAPGTYSHASAVGAVGGRTLALHGDEGLTGPEGAAFLRVFDGDPASASFMTELGRYQSRPEVGIHNFELVGDRAYIAYYQDGVRVVDLSDPTSPREVAHYNTWDPESAPGGAFEGAFGVRVVDGLIYVADSERGLLIFREN
jgi:hypothetical protein